MISNIKTAAGSLGVQLLILDARKPDEFDAAYMAMAKERVAALFVFGDVMFSVHRARLAELAIKHRLPTMYTNRPHVEAGGLMCYAPNFFDLWRRAATYVDKILKGAKPGDLPVEQPTKFELVINLKTAKALGLTIPPALLARADEVIRMNRRDFVALLGGTAVGWPVATNAQQAAKVARIGWLAGSLGGSPHVGEAFLQGLRDLGYVEGRNVVIEYRSTEGKVERYPALAAELVALKVDVILAPATPDALAAKQVTRTLPIVFVGAADPVTS